MQQTYVAANSCITNSMSNNVHHFVTYSMRSTVSQTRAHNDDRDGYLTSTPKSAGFQHTRLPIYRQGRINH